MTAFFLPLISFHTKVGSLLTYANNTYLQHTEVIPTSGRNLLEIL